MSDPVTIDFCRCPLCGREVEADFYNIARDTFGAVSCDHCSLELTGNLNESPTDLARRWNRLHPPSGPTNLSFDLLRRANLARLPTFRNRLGQPAHSEADGSDWSDAEWLQAVTGELGELANEMKKRLRGDYVDLPAAEVRQRLADELADVQTYLDILAFRLGVDLGAATVEKFNAVSTRVGSPVRIIADSIRIETAPAGEAR
ncbi:hypothetical protein [Zavarzinia sp.]|uniref:hypothetical protein n=1 Tax=Zavarzinia sp. TaxID=2027920 RepID=UPI003BB48DDC